MPKYEIDQRTDDELIVRCTCGDNHFSTFSFVEDEEDKYFYVHLILIPQSFWQRVVAAFKFVFKGGNVCYDEIMLAEKDLKKLEKLIKKYKKI